MPSGDAKRKDSQQRKKREAGNDAGSSQRRLAKKARAQTSAEASESEQSDISLNTGSELVDCDLEFYDPRPKDTPGLQDLLRHLLDGKDLDLDELTQAIVQQARVGTVVKTAEDEDPLGVITVLNLQTHSGLKALGQIKRFLHKACLSKDTRALLEQAWGSPGTGLVVSERVYNCPPQLAAPLQQALFDEILWATEDEPDQAQRSSFHFDRYVMLTRSFTSTELTEQQQQPVSKKKRKKAQASLIYMRPEDEFYHKHATWSFTSIVPNRPAGYEDLQQLRLCMLLSAEQVKSARSELEAVVGNLAAGQ